MAERQQRRVLPAPARPGSIFARAGEGYVLLAGSKQVPSCFADPFLLPDEALAGTAANVSRAVRLEYDEVVGALLDRREKRFAWIKRGLSADEAAAVEALRCRAVGITYEWRRHYPNAALAATTLGFRRQDGEGGGGLELALQDHLAPMDGQYVVKTDRFGRPIWTVADEDLPLRHGRNVYLCLDACIQGFLESAVSKAVSQYGVEGRTWGAGVVVEPATGKVLAICSVPTFNPNEYSTAPAESRLNRAIGMPFEPGSVAKPIFAAAAVDAGLLTYGSRIFCENGAFRAPRGGRISDHGQSYGELSLEDIVVFSSNIGMAKVGLMLGNQRLHAAAMRAGFGRKTGIELPGEDAGIVRDLRRWNTYSTPRVPFGQELSTTALQLTMAFCALANGGELLRPRLVDCIADADGNIVYSGRREAIRRVVSPSTARESLKVLRQVVERGTGKACRLSRWTSFGKTGTAQIPGPGGYVDGAYTGTFVGGAPAEEPQLVCLISVYWPEASRGYYGSRVAAPFVKEVLERSLAHLGVPGDLAVCAAPGGQGGVRR